MNHTARIAGLFLLVGLLWSTTGCRYFTNRYYDFRDTIAIGAGVNTENSVTGVMPPSLGVYLEATDLFHLGAMKFNGYTAETDMRGTFVGPEASSRFGFLWWQSLRINQDYENAFYKNAFKNEDFPWCHRMESIGNREYGQPAKRLHYEYWATMPNRGTWLLHRGWQYWEYVGAQVGVADPFVTHVGLMLRLGFDLSEVSDFALGWLGLDFKHDDMNRDEYVIFREKADVWGMRLVPVRSRRELLPLTDEETGTKPAANGEKGESVTPGADEDPAEAAPAPAPPPAQ
jgi:hypothetical protein